MGWGTGTEIAHPRTAWSATLSATTVEPTGWTRNNTPTYYQQNGYLTICRFQFTSGSGATWGEGAWRIALPVSAATASNNQQMCGEVYLYDGGQAHYGSVIIDPGAPTYARFVDADVPGSSSDYYTAWGMKTSGNNGFWPLASAPNANAVFFGEFFYESSTL